MMKKSIFLFLLICTVFLFSCQSKEDKIRETVTSYLSKQMKNPESFKILSMEIRKDTVPFYLSNDVLKKAEKTKDAFKEYDRYKDRNYLWADEKYESRKNLMKAKEELDEEYKSAKYEPAEIEDIVYIKSSGTNSIGGTISSSFIVIINKEDPTDILGVFHVDEDFVQQYVIIKLMCEGFDFKKNKFGKYEVEGLPYIDQFIMNEAD